MGSRAQLAGADRWGDYDRIFGAARAGDRGSAGPFRGVPGGASSKMTKRFHNAWVMLKVYGFAFRRLKMLWTLSIRSRETLHMIFTSCRILGTREIILLRDLRP